MTSDKYKEECELEKPAVTTMENNVPFICLFLYIISSYIIFYEFLSINITIWEFVLVAYFFNCIAI